MLILMLVIMMLIFMLLNLNTGYADTDADLCVKFLSFRYHKYRMRERVTTEQFFSRVRISNVLSRTINIYIAFNNCFGLCSYGQISLKRKSNAFECSILSKIYIHLYVLYKLCIHDIFRSLSIFFFLVNKLSFTSTTTCF